MMTNRRFFSAALLSAAIGLCLPSSLLAGEYDLAASSYFGGTGAEDSVRGTEILDDGRLVMAANLDDYVPPALENLDFSGNGGNGALVILTPDGQSVLSIYRVADYVWDLDRDKEGNLYVACGSRGLLKFDPVAKQVVWRQRDGTGDFIYRLDVGDDNYVAALELENTTESSFTAVDTRSIDNTYGAHGFLFLFDDQGQFVTGFQGGYNVQDVALDASTQSILYIGWFNTYAYTGAQYGNGYAPVDIPYITARDYAGAQKWQAHNYNRNPWIDQDTNQSIPDTRFVNYPFSTDPSNIYTAAEAAALGKPLLEGNPKEFTNNMADTRGYRISMGDDGFMYALYEVDGGNHQIRYNPFDLTEPVEPIDNDGWFHAFFNTNTVPKIMVEKYLVEPSSATLIFNWGYTNRLPDGRDNTIPLRGGFLEADKEGNMYVGGYTFSGLALPGVNAPYPVPRAGETTIDGFPAESSHGAFLLIMSPNADKRLLMARLGGGKSRDLAMWYPQGSDTATIFWGGEVQNSPNSNLNKLFTLNAIQPVRGSDGQPDPWDGFFALILPDLAPGAPAFLSSPKTFAERDAAYSANITALDPENQIVSFNPVDMPSWMSLSNQGSGLAVLSGTAPDKYGVYNVTVEADDGTDTTQQSFQVAVVEEIGNLAPDAFFKEERTGTVLELELDASDSRDDDGFLVDYAWELGDGNTASGAIVTHTYASPGTYQVTLTVTDNEGATDRTTHNVLALDQGLGGTLIDDDWDTAAEFGPWQWFVDGAFLTGQNGTVDLPFEGDDFKNMEVRWLQVLNNAWLNGNDGIIAARPKNGGDYMRQAFPVWRDFLLPEDLTGGTLSTEGFYNDPSNPNSGEIYEYYMIVRYLDGGTEKWAVSDADLTTTTSDAVVPGSWALDTLTFSELDIDATYNLDGAAVPTSTVLSNALGAGFMNVLEGRYLLNDRGAVESYTLEAPVQVANTFPQFDSTPVFSAVEGEAYSYTVQASDADLDTVTINPASVPGWLTLSGTTNGEATLSGNPGAAEVGTHAVELTVTDGNGGTGYQSFTITVTAASATPVNAPVDLRMVDLEGDGADMTWTSEAGLLYQVRVGDDFTQPMDDLGPLYEGDGSLFRFEDGTADPQSEQRRFYEVQARPAN